MMEDDSLRSNQIKTLERMLHLNKDGSTDLTLATKNEEIIWKALVLDKKSQSIVSSVLRVNDLLRCGITIHQLINGNRSNLPDVTVIYFIEPTVENIMIIIDDLTHDKYDEFYINFTSNIKRDLLEEFAKKVSLIGKSYKIKQIYDQYLNYIVTEPNLFSLDIHNIFTKFNSPGTLEDEIHKLADEISDGLLSIILTMGNIPIIRCQRNGPSELVASTLDLKLRDHLSNSKHLNQSIQKRSVLIILDRNIDLSSMFNHSWIYQCMISDIFNLKRNTIKINNKQYDIDPKDFFWIKNSQLPFPDVVENANLELEIYKKDAQDLTVKTGVNSLNDIDLNATNKSTSDTARIQQAVDALPELTARKSTLDMHMDVLASLLKELESKSLDKFFEIEQNYNNPKIQQEFMEILIDVPKSDNILDKLRTFIILYLINDDLPKSFINEVKSKFKELDPSIDLNCLKYFEKFKQISRLSNLSSLNEASDGDLNINHNNNSALFNNLSSRLYGLTEGKLSEGLSSLTSGLKKLLPNKKNLPITNIVESIMDPSSSSNSSSTIQITDDYLYLDPKSRGGHSKPPKRQSYDNATVFVVGGGNYLEYQNLQELVGNSGKSIVYGSSDILTANEFLLECNKLGELEN